MPRLYRAEQRMMRCYILFCFVVQCPVYIGLNNSEIVKETDISRCAMPRLYRAEQHPRCNRGVRRGCAMPRLYRAEQPKSFAPKTTLCCAMPRLYRAEQRRR